MTLPFVEIYIVIIEDRHTEATAHPFASPEVAVDEARRFAKDTCKHDDYYREHDYGKDEGWLFYAQYSCEDDHVRVVTATLDEAI